MTSPLLSLSNQQWEDLCDGCGRCCLVKLQDEDSGEIAYTNVACRFFDAQTCRCTDYDNRSEINPRCMVLGKDRLDVLEVMPFTCAYRLAHEGRQLDQPAESLKVTGSTVSEEYIDDDQLIDHIIHWISTESDDRAD